jgi:signal peptidase I
MEIPTKYSQLTIRQRSVLGVILTYVIFTVLSMIVGFWLLNGLSLIMYGIAFGFLLRYTRSNYYLSLSIGNSMFPAIPQGVTVHLCNRNTEDIDIYDVVTYEEKDTVDSNIDYIHHRVVSKCEDGYILRGDNNYTNDPIVDRDRVVHKTVQYGYQPLYLPLTPFSMLATLVKIYKKIQGRHKDSLEQSIKN